MRKERRKEEEGEVGEIKDREGEGEGKEETERMRRAAEGRERMSRGGEGALHWRMLLLSPKRRGGVEKRLFQERKFSCGKENSKV